MESPAELRMIQGAQRRWSTRLYNYKYFNTDKDLSVLQRPFNWDVVKWWTFLDSEEYGKKHQQSHWRLLPGIKRWLNNHGREPEHGGGCGEGRGHMYWIIASMLLAKFGVLDLHKKLSTLYRFLNKFFLIFLMVKTNLHCSSYIYMTRKNIFGHRLAFLGPIIEKLAFYFRILSASKFRNKMLTFQ